LEQLVQLPNGDFEAILKKEENNDLLIHPNRNQGDQEAFANKF
jgi:hypothetical protein